MLAFMRKVPFIARLGGLASGAVLLVSAWVFYFDDRRPSHSSMVGILTIELPEGRGRGTAVLVDACGILTTFHAVFGPWYVTAIRKPSHEFVATFTLTEATQLDGASQSTSATPVVWGNYLGPDRQFRRAGEDWVYLVLEDCLGLNYGYFNIRPLEPEELEGSEELSAIGYSSGSQMMDPRCAIEIDPSVQAGAWQHDCVLLLGDSGGPLFVRDTKSLVALGSSAVARPGEPICGADTSGATAIRRDGTVACANLAVPLSREIIARVRDAEIACGVQRVLLQLGYDAGPLGSVDEPKARAAIEQFQRSVGLDVTGEATDSLWMILLLQLYMG